MSTYEVGGITRITWDDPALTPRWRRLYKQGTWAVGAWVVFWFAVMMGSVVTHWGPFGWIASLQIYLIGSDGPILSALPALVMMGVPAFVVGRMEKTPEHPFLFGMQDAVDAKRKPRLEPAPGAAQRRLRRMMRGGLSAGIAALLLMGLGWWWIDRIDAAGRAPLAGLSFAQVVSGAPLPAVARVNGVSAYPQMYWTHDTSVRQTLYRNVYYPLAPAGWTPAQTVRLIELDRLLPNDAPGPGNVLNEPGPREGRLRTLDDDWLAEQLTGAGMKLAGHPVVLERQPLHGLQPLPSDGSAVPGIMIFLGASAFTAFLLAWSARRALGTFVTPDGAGTPR